MQTRAIVRSSLPRIAYMLPGFLSAARCIAIPRAAIIRKPSSSEKAPAAVSAAYSPSEWPATAEGSHLWETTE